MNDSCDIARTNDNGLSSAHRFESQMAKAARNTEPPNNEQLADALDEVGELLEAQGANPFRVRAYRNGAATVRALKGPVHQILRAEGIGGLTRLPGIGDSLAHALEQLVRSGRLPLLERLRGEDAAERIFATVPDIGPELARRIHETLGIESLAELEAAANDGRLATVQGMGRKRIRAVRESLAGRFARRRSTGSREQAPREQAPHEQAPPAANVPVSELLDIDQQYRHLAEQQKLPRIAPRRFNPTGEAWLPVLHTVRGPRHYTALFSNTARAHELGTTHDWVVIYRDDDEHGRWTVITANFGALRGRRIVRGREAECKRHYAEQKRQTSLLD